MINLKRFTFFGSTIKIVSPILDGVSTTAHLKDCTERQFNTNPELSHPISLARLQQELAQIRVGALWDCEKQQGRRDEKRREVVE